jgi:hypothetical protein
MSITLQQYCRPTGRPRRDNVFGRGEPRVGTSLSLSLPKKKARTYALRTNQLYKYNTSTPAARTPPGGLRCVRIIIIIIIINITVPRAIMIELARGSSNLRGTHI